MAGYSARQSSFTTGDTITAAHSNDEFNQVLAAFNATTGHTHDGTAGEGGPVTTIRDANTLNRVLVDSTNNHLEFYVNVSSSSVQQFRVQDGAIVPITDNDIDLGTSSLEFKDLFIDGTANVDAINLDGTLITSTAAELNILDGVTSTAAELNLVDGITAGTVSASLAVIVDSNKDIAGFRNISNTGNITTNGTIEIDVASGDPTIILDTQGADKFHFAVDDSDSDNLVIKSGGTVGSGSGLKLDSSGNLTVDGDLTVSGDDITMGTNTAGNLLIADGTNFNSIAVGSLSEISSIASDDVFLAVDTSGGGLKKVARSTVVSGLATSSAISNVVEDTTPQLGGDLDMNGQDIVTTSNADIDLAPNGTGKVVVKGNSNPGTVVFNCESNSHGQTVKSQPHSASVTNVLTLPPGGDQEIVGTTATQSLTNKTFSDGLIASGSPTLANNMGTLGYSSPNVELKSKGATAGNLDIHTTNSSGTTARVLRATHDGHIQLMSGDTVVGKLSNSSSDFVIESDVQDKDILFKGDDNGSGITALTLDMSDAGTAVFNHDIKIADDGQIGSASDPDAMTISSSGVVTFSQAPVFPDGVVPLVDLDIDGGTDIGADLTTSDLIIVDDGAGGTNRKAALSRVVTLMTAQGFTTDDPTALAIALG